MVYSTRRYLFYILLCIILFLCFSVLLALRLPRLGKRELILVVFVNFVRFVLVWFCWFPLTLGVCEELRFVIVALPGLFSYFFFELATVNESSVFESLRFYCSLQKGLPCSLVLQKKNNWYSITNATVYFANSYVGVIWCSLCFRKISDRLLILQQRCRCHWLTYIS